MSRGCAHWQHCRFLQQIFSGNRECQVNLCFNMNVERKFFFFWSLQAMFELSLFSFVCLTCNWKASKEKVENDLSMCASAAWFGFLLIESFPEIYHSFNYQLKGCDYATPSLKAIVSRLPACLVGSQLCKSYMIVVIGKVLLLLLP